MLISAQEARQLSASDGEKWDLDDINKSIRIAAQTGLYSVAVHLDRNIPKESINTLEKRLRAAGYSTEVGFCNLWSIVIGWR